MSAQRSRGVTDWRVIVEYQSPKILYDADSYLAQQVAERGGNPDEYEPSDKDYERIPAELQATVKSGFPVSPEQPKDEQRAGGGFGVGLDAVWLVLSAVEKYASLRVLADDIREVARRLKAGEADGGIDETTAMLVAWDYVDPPGRGAAPTLEYVAPLQRISGYGGNELTGWLVGFTMTDAPPVTVVVSLGGSVLGALPGSGPCNDRRSRRTTTTVGVSQPTTSDEGT